MITNKINVTSVSPIAKSTEFYYLKANVDNELDIEVIVDKENLRQLIQTIDNAIL